MFNSRFKKRDNYFFKYLFLLIITNGLFYLPRLFYIQIWKLFFSHKSILWPVVRACWSKWPLTGGVSAGKAFPSLYNNIRVTAATQIQVHLTVRETAVEEIWPRPEGEKDRDGGGTQWCFSNHCHTGKKMQNDARHSLFFYLPTTSLMTLVKTPLRTRVRVTAGWQEETELNHEKDTSPQTAGRHKKKEECL